MRAPLTSALGSRGHRTLGTTLNTLIDAGFDLRRVEEFAPTREQIEQSPELADEMERPMMLLVSARKTQDG